MDTHWRNEFRHRLAEFEANSGERDALVVSVKIRVSSGCFHREHSPAAYRLIDSFLENYPLDERREQYLEHESGPEILAYLAVAAAGLGLATSIIELVTTIIKARSDGIRKGDKPKEPLELIVRGFRSNDEYFQETTLRIEHSSSVDTETIKRAIDGAFKTLPKPQRKARGKEAR